MRKFLSLAIAVARLAVVAAVGGWMGVPARAYYTNVNGVTWTYLLVDGNASVCYSRGSWGGIFPTIDRETSGAISIPSSLAGYPVTDIGEMAFYGCYKLTSVAIPNGVTNIGQSAFSGCSNLVSVAIPNGLTSIEDWTFGGCRSLKSLAIPNGVADIGAYAFSGCAGLTSITIPASVTNIGQHAFWHCTGLTSVNIPAGVTNIRQGTFAGCSSLTSMTIPESVTSIGSGAFLGCIGLTSITIPGNVTTDYRQPASESDYVSQGPFGSCSNLATVVLGNKMTKIGSYMFARCGALRNVTIPDSVTNIGDGAFSYCTNLANVTIPDSVTSIGRGAFSGTALTNVTVPESVTDLGQGAFSMCPSLIHATILGNVTNIGGASPFGWGTTNLTTVVLGDKMTKIWYYMFEQCSSLTNVVVGNGVTEIGYRAFYGCTGLTELGIPDSVTNILSETFCGCTGLTQLTIPDRVTRIAYQTFYRCTGLTELTIPDSVTDIGQDAFERCTNMRSVTIGTGVTNIGDGAFFWCTNLAAIHISDLAAWCRIQYEDYYRSSSSSPLYWGHNLYLNGELLTEAIIPDSVTNIGDYAFVNCTNLTSITIPDSVRGIGDSAFSGCSGLTELTIPDSVTEIGSYSLNCPNLQTLYVPGAWKTKFVNGTFWRTWARVPDGCKVIYGGKKQARAENVRAVQRPKTTLVDVYYDLVGGEAKERYAVTLSVASEKGGLPVGHVTGDAGGGVGQGRNRHIVWDAGTDWPDGEAEAAVATVAAPGGSAESAPFALDTCQPVVIQDVRSAYCSGEYGGYGGKRATFRHGTECEVGLRVEAETHRGAEVAYYEVNGGVRDGQFTFDVGSLLVGDRLKVVAVDMDGNKSNPFAANFDVALPPPFMDSLVLAHPRPEEGRVVYRAPEFRSLQLFDLFSGFAEVGGVDYGMEWAPQFKLSRSMDSGTGQYREGPDVGVQGGPVDEFGRFGPLSVGMSLTGGTVYDYDPAGRVWVRSERELGVALDGEVSVRQRVPQFPLLYGDVGMLSHAAFMAREEGGIWYSDIGLDPVVALRAGLGLGLDVVIEGEVYGQGGLSLEARVPGGLDYIGIKGEFGWRAVVAGFEHGGTWWEADHAIYGGHRAAANAAARAVALADDGGFRPIARDYGKGRPRTAAAKAADGEGEPLVLAADGYPAPQPSLAANGYREALLYLRDNPERADLDRTELVFRSGQCSRNGETATWGEEEAVWDDGTADFMPKAALLSDGTVFAAWANEGRTLAEGTPFKEACKAMELAVGVRNASSGEWSCTNLTDDTALDWVPVLKAATNGTAAVAWTRNVSGAYVGSAEAPSDLCVAFFRDGAWSEASVAVEGAGVVLSHDLAWDGGRAALVWAVDADGDLATGGDTEIRAAAFGDGAWGAPVRLSAAGAGAASPYAWFRADGTLHAIWTEDGTLFAADGLAEGGGAAVAGAEKVSVPAGYRLVPGSATNTLLVWPVAAEGAGGCLGGDLAGVGYSPGTGIRGMAATLLATDAEERNVSGAITPGGALRLAYESVAVSGGGARGAVGLAVWRSKAGTDVGVSAEGCSFAEAPAAGTTNRLVVKVENYGATDSGNVAWRIWDGDGSTLIGSGTVAVPAFSCVPVSADWVPEEGLADIAFLVEAGGNGTLAWRPDAG